MSNSMVDAGGTLPMLQDNRAAARKRETAHVFVRETLRMAILNGVLTGGTRLVQSELATQLEVSTTPVREALRDLASEGLIQIDPHRGGIVAQLDEDDVEEVYLLRQRLEPLAVELAIPLMSPAVIARARSLHDAMAAAPDSAAWVELNREFHMTLYKPCNRPRLLATLQQLQDACVMMISNFFQAIPDFRQVISIEHEQLVDAVEAGDVERATAVILEHITISIRALKHPETRGPTDRQR